MMTRRQALVRLGLSTIGVLTLSCSPAPAAAPAAKDAGAKPAAPAPAATTAPAGAAKPAEATKPAEAAKPAADAKPAAAAPAAPSGNIADLLTVGGRGDIEQLDPAILSGVNNYPVAGAIFNFLVAYTPGTSNIVPDLASKWDISPDGKVYTFYLRQGVQFHKGYGEFTSEDVKYQFERIIDPTAKSMWQSRFNMIERIETPDKYTVKFNLKNPYAPFLSLLAGFRGGPIASKKAVMERGKDFPLNPIGTGPYVFESWTPKTELIMSRNDQYFGEPAKVRRIRLIPIADENIAASAIQKGDIALRYFRDPVVLTELERNSNIVIDRKPLAGAWGLFYKLDAPPFDNLQVRQAVNHAINRAQIVKNVLTGVAVESVTFLSPTQNEATSDVTTYEYSPEKAKQLLTAAGHPNGFRLDLLSSELAPWPLVVPVVVENLKAVGINAELRQLEEGTYRAETRNRNFGMTIQGFVDVPDPDGTTFSLFHSSSIPSSNPAGYRDGDALIEKSRAEVDPEKRKAEYIELQKKIAADAVYVPMFHLGAQLVRRSNIQGVPVGIMNDVPLNSVSVQ